MEMNFCRRCGSPLTKLSEQENICSNNHTVYITSAPGAGVFFVTPDDKILLSRRAIDPNKGMLDCIGGFVDINETFEQAARREIEEETGLTKDNYGPLQYITSAFVQYDFGGEMIPALSNFYWAKTVSLDKLSPRDDVAEIVALPIGEIDAAELANDDIRQAFSELKTKLAVNNT